MSPLSKVLLFIAAVLITVDCRATISSEDILEAMMKLEEVTDASIERNLNRLMESRKEYDVVMGGNLRNALKKMRENVRNSIDRLENLESEAGVDVKECTEDVGKTISRIPIIPTKDMFLCMNAEEKNVNQVTKKSQESVKDVERIVDELETKATNCGDEQCLQDVLVEILETIESLPTIVNVKGNAGVRAIENVQSSMIECTSKTINLVEVKIWAVEYHATKCIEEKSNK
ncbi:PREDICTED: uncharacterized protein LOC108561181 [Nicrophorus vespilloides]|uniref:Uncharacterized protein LOC108561181 n=1 Tax=Nicrophorus vespilloides TaxID=110193 RepID=A0ABM1MIT8_NICVS|nr:PREDICTED: uncharacterized protein LOC108561181 [Nicrophorus vespilloides]